MVMAAAAACTMAGRLWRGAQQPPRALQQPRCPACGAPDLGARWPCCSLGAGMEGLVRMHDAVLVDKTGPAFHRSVQECVHRHVLPFQLLENEFGSCGLRSKAGMAEVVACGRFKSIIGSGGSSEPAKGQIRSFERQSCVLGAQARACTAMVAAAGVRTQPVPWLPACRCGLAPATADPCQRSARADGGQVARSAQEGVGAAGGQQRCVRRMRRGLERDVRNHSVHARPQDRYLLFYGGGRV